MERRSFLRGVFGGVTTGGLILAASPKEIEVFAAPLKPDQPLMLDRFSPLDPNFHEGMVLYNAAGERVVEIQNAEIHFRRGALTTITIEGLPTMHALAMVYPPSRR